MPQDYSERSWTSGVNPSGAKIRLLGTTHYPPTLFDKADDVGHHDDPEVSTHAFREMSSIQRATAAPWDQLPYTSQFEEIYAEFVGRVPLGSALERISCETSKQGVWLLGLRVRKAGLGKAFTERQPGLELPIFCVRLLTEVMPLAWSRRDQLPYSKKFLATLDAYNYARPAHCPAMSRSELWRAILAVAKKKRTAVDSVGQRRLWP